MLSFDYTLTLALTAKNFGLAIDAIQFSLVKQLADHGIIEIADCLTRAEMHEKYGRIQTSAKLLGSKGGKGRSNNQALLVNEVINLYVSENYRIIPVLKAANCIAAHLERYNPDLLRLSSSKNKAIAIQNIIRKFNSENFT